MKSEYLNDGNSNICNSIQVQYIYLVLELTNKDGTGLMENSEDKADEIQEPLRLTTTTEVRFQSLKPPYQHQGKISCIYDIDEDYMRKRV